MDNAYYSVKIRREGTTPSDLIKYLNRNNISTPATRTAQLAELKQAGIITLIDKHYVIDKRGIAFKAAYDYYNEYYHLSTTLRCHSHIKEEDSQKVLFF